MGADGQSLFTRTQAAKFLSLRIDTVRRAEERGALRFVLLNGVHCFLREELERYRGQTRHGEVAGRAFEAFRRGLSAAEVVVEQSLAPELVRDLMTNYAELSESVLCCAPRGSRASWEAAFGVKLTPALVLRAVELAARTPSVRVRLLVGQ